MNKSALKVSDVFEKKVIWEGVKSALKVSDVFVTKVTSEQVNLLTLSFREYV